MATVWFAERDVNIFSEYLKLDLGDRIESLLNFFGCESAENADIVSGMVQLMTGSSSLNYLAAPKSIVVCPS